MQAQKMQNITTRSRVRDTERSNFFFFGKKMEERHVKNKYTFIEFGTEIICVKLSIESN